LRKKTIFNYEFKRLVSSREYLLLLVTLLVYCVSLLRTSVIFGTDYTAPFSQWTFCDYLSSITVLLHILLLTMCAQQFTPSERGMSPIINAAPMPLKTFKAIRYGAIALAFAIAVILSIGICFVFYGVIFDYTAFGELILTALIMLFPSVLLVFGIAMLLGEKKTVLIYTLLTVILITGIFRIPLPSFLDIIGSSSILPLYEGTHTFTFTLPFIAGRIVFIAVGIGCIGWSLSPAKNRRKTRVSSHTLS